MCRLFVSTSSTRHPAEKGNEIHATNCHTLPVTARDISSYTAKDPTLSKVFTCVQHGAWHFPLPEELVPFHRKKDEFTLQGSQCAAVSSIALSSPGHQM